MGIEGAGASRRGRDRDRDLGGAFQYSRRLMCTSCIGCASRPKLALSLPIKGPSFRLTDRTAGEVRRSRIGGGERSEPISRMPIIPYDTESQSRNADFKNCGEAATTLSEPFEPERRRRLSIRRLYDFRRQRRYKKWRPKGRHTFPAERCYIPPEGGALNPPVRRSRSQAEPWQPRAKGPAAGSTLTPVRACQPSGIQLPVDSSQKFMIFAAAGVP